MSSITQTVSSAVSKAAKGSPRFSTSSLTNRTCTMYHCPPLSHFKCWPSANLMADKTQTPVCLTQAYDRVEGERYLIVSALGVGLDILPSSDIPAFQPLRQSRGSHNTPSEFMIKEEPHNWATFKSRFSFPFTGTSTTGRLLPGVSIGEDGAEVVAGSRIGGCNDEAAGDGRVDGSMMELEKLMSEMGAREDNFVDYNFVFSDGAARTLVPFAIDRASGTINEGLSFRGVIAKARFKLPTTPERSKGGRSDQGDGEIFSTWHPSDWKPGDESLYSPFAAAVNQMKRRCVTDRSEISKAERIESTEHWQEASSEMDVANGRSLSQQSAMG